ncbi:hypothetical protein BC936DRAFT_140964, partial [Jimgerdemannia flammicorona]
MKLTWAKAHRTSQSAGVCLNRDLNDLRRDEKRVVYNANKVLVLCMGTLKRHKGEFSFPRPFTEISHFVAPDINP